MSNEGFGLAVLKANSLWRFEYLKLIVLYRPFRACYCLRLTITQGVALGWYVMPLRG